MSYNSNGFESKSFFSFNSLKVTQPNGLFPFIIGVIQDSCETALNSAGDALFSSTAEYYERGKRGEDINFLGEFAKN